MATWDSLKVNGLGCLLGMQLPNTSKVPDQLELQWAVANDMIKCIRAEDT